MAVWNILTFIFITKYNNFTELVKIHETQQNMLTEGFNKAKGELNRSGERR